MTLPYQIWYQCLVIPIRHFGLFVSLSSLWQTSDRWTSSPLSLNCVHLRPSNLASRSVSIGSILRTPKLNISLSILLLPLNYLCISFLHALFFFCWCSSLLFVVFCEQCINLVIHMGALQILILFFFSLFLLSLSVLSIFIYGLWTSRISKSTVCFQCKSAETEKRGICGQL